MWLDCNFKSVSDNSTVSAVCFAECTLGPPDIVQGGVTTAALDHCFGHCIRAALGHGPQVTGNLHTELKGPVLPLQTYRCDVRLVRKEAFSKKNRRSTQKVHFEATLGTADGGNLLATATALFIAIGDANGNLSHHHQQTPEEVAEAHVIALQKASSPEISSLCQFERRNGRLHPPFGLDTCFSCRGGTWMDFSPSRHWVETDPMIQTLVARRRGSISSTTPDALTGNGERHTILDEEELMVERELEGLAYKTNMQALDNKVLEFYAESTDKASVTGVVRFLRSCSGPPGTLTRC